MGHPTPRSVHGLTGPGAKLPRMTSALHSPSVADRPLGSTETIYWLLDALYCLNFVVFAEIEGHLDATRLAQALETVQAENPLLRVRIVRLLGTPAFQPASGPLVALTPTIKPLKNWRSVVEDELHTRFDTQHAPLARFFWFRGTGKKAVVAMCFHHTIADGRSGTSVLLDVLRRATTDTSPAVYKRALASSQTLDVIRQKPPLLGALQGAKFWLNKGKEVLQFPQQLPGFDPVPRADRQVRVLPLCIAPPLLAQLMAQARQHHTTVHGALGAALLLALQAQFPNQDPRRLALNSLADLRSVLNGNLTDRDLGLYGTTLCTIHRGGPHTEFRHMARWVRDALKQTMDAGDGNLINGVYPSHLVLGPQHSIAKLVQSAIALGPAASMLTNIGKIDAVDLGPAVRIQSLGFCVSPPAQHPICVTAASYGGRMQLHLLHDEHKISPEQARDIADAVMAHLAAACHLGGSPTQP